MFLAGFLASRILERLARPQEKAAYGAIPSVSSIFVSTIANHALALLARLFRFGSVGYHGGFVNLATGQVSSLPVDPTVWSRMRRSAEKERRRLR